MYSATLCWNKTEGAGEEEEEEEKKVTGEEEYRGRWKK